MPLSHHGPGIAQDVRSGRARTTCCPSTYRRPTTTNNSQHPHRPASSSCKQSGVSLIHLVFLAPISFNRSFNNTPLLQASLSSPTNKGLPQHARHTFPATTSRHRPDEGRTRSLFHFDHSSLSVFKSRLSFCASYAPRRHIPAQRSSSSPLSFFTFEHPGILPNLVHSMHLGVLHPGCSVEPQILWAWPLQHCRHGYIAPLPALH